MGDRKRSRDRFHEVYSRELKRNGLTPTHLDNEVNPQDAARIAASCLQNPSIWYSLGRLLGLHNGDLEPIKTENQSEKTRAIKMLDSWLNRCDQGNNTYEYLLLTLFELEDKDCKATINNIFDFMAEKFETEGSGDLKGSSDHESESGLDSDNSDISDKDLKFLCGCGKCSLENFLAHGCPNPTETKNYPLLDIKKLPKRKKVALLARLELEAEEVRKQFTKLLKSITDSLAKPNNQGVLKQLKLTIFSSQQFIFVLEQEKFISDVQAAEDILDLFSILCSKLLSWFNHSFLKTITESYNVCEEEYAEYVNTTLRNFLRKSLYQIPRNSFNSIEPESSEILLLKITVPPPKEGVQASVIPLILGHVAELLGITVSSLELCDYNEGCIEITVGAPAQILKATFMTENTDLLIDIGSFVIEPHGLKIRNVIYQGKEHKAIYRRECQKELRVEESQRGFITTALSKVDESFTKLVLKLSTLGLSQVFDILSNLSTHKFSPNEPAVEDFFTNDMKQYLSSETIFDLIQFLSSYWSFINFSLVKYILINSINPEDAASVELEEYVQALSALEIKQLPVLLFPEFCPERFCPDSFVLKVQSEVFYEKAETLLGIQSAFAESFHLESQSVLIARLDKTNHEIYFLVVLNAQEGIVRQLQSKTHNLLIEQRVQQVKFEEQVFKLIGTEKEKPERSQESLSLYESNTATMEEEEEQVLPMVTVDAEIIKTSTNSTSDATAHAVTVLANKDKSFQNKKGILLVCEKCFEENNNHFTLADELCLNESDHKDARRSTFGWDFGKNVLVKIRPLPAQKYQFNVGNFPVISCDPSRCLGETRCTHAHSVVEKDAWNHQKRIERELKYKPEPSEKAGYGSSRDLVKAEIESNAQQRKGVLQICEACYFAGYITSEVCMNPYQHNASRRIFAAWSQVWQCYMQINPRPPIQLPPGNRFRLCKNPTSCSKHNCTFAHSEIERDAWNEDLLQGTSGGNATPSNSFGKKISGSHNNSAPRLQRQDWFTKYKSRLEKILKRDVKSLKGFELSASNYREKFYHSLVVEELKHIEILKEKCDGVYNFKFGTIQWNNKTHCNVRIGIVKGMSQDQFHYAAQASSGVYILDPANESHDICRADLSGQNFWSTADFEIEISLEDSNRLKSSLKPNNGEYKVRLEFDLKHSYFETLHRAVTSVPLSAISKIMLRHIDQREKEICKPMRKCEHKKLDVDDAGQTKALEAIMQKPSKLPIVISGPFGSGKTRVIARAVYDTVMESLESKKPVKILVCAHHYETTNTYAFGYFQKAFKNKRQVTVIKIDRPYASERVSMDHSSNVLTLSSYDFKQYVERGSYDKAMNVIVVATYMVSINIADCLNKSKSRQFTHVFLDEAAQPREPEAVASLCATNSETKLVIAGDSKQVGPHVVVLIENKMLQTSLLKRLEDEYSKRGLLGNYLLQLGRNYRCHPKLTHLLNSTMYGYPIHSNQLEKSDHPCLMNRPCVFHCCDVQDDASASSLSEMEAMKRESSALIEQLEEYLWDWPDTPSWNKNGYEDICMISSNRTQLIMLKNQLKKSLFCCNEPFTMKPSYSIQGHEFQAIFLCTADYKDSSGFISNPIKSLTTPGIFNTVLSRSKSFVVAVGNPFTLLDAEEKMGQDKMCWREYLKLCLKDDTVTFSKEIEDPESVKAKIAERIDIVLPPKKSKSDPVQKQGLPRSLSSHSATTKQSSTTKNRTSITKPTIPTPVQKSHSAPSDSNPLIREVPRPIRRSRDKRERDWY